ncbi:MAG TPA: YggS family pyridoxal phosphate-dependent enzyme [bacterium]|jgi:pyridoxal phosphate enzyme (YggS family)|nr:YggS family pyridoxal phosphate-dependent enzyme [bacterium]
MELQTQIHDIQKRIQDSAAKAGRNPSDVFLLAVTKTKTVDQIQKAYDAGLKDFGENRVQEALEKMPLLPWDVRWHLIGQLQTNKINKTLGRFVLIHSIDSVELAQGVSDRQVEHTQDVLLEVNTSGEASKSGVDPAAAFAAAKAISQMPHLKLKGLMTVGPLTDDRQKQRDAFKKLKELFDKMKTERWGGDSFSVLSMGMSGDFEMAIEEGSTLVRVGSAIFGARV